MEEFKAQESQLLQQLHCNEHIDFQKLFVIPFSVHKQGFSVGIDLLCR